MSDSEHNPYKPPESSLEQPVAPVSPDGRFVEGSLEGALRGDFELPPTEMIQEARALSNGAKLVLWGGAFIAGILTWIATVVTSVLAPGDVFVATLIGAIGGILLSPLTSGVLMMGVRRSVDGQVQVGQVFEYFHRWPDLFLGSAIVVALTNGPTLLLASNPFATILFTPVNVVVAILTLFWIPLVLDREMSAIEALKTSFQVGLKKFLGLFIYLFVIGLIGTVFLLLTIGIGLIWAVPYFLVINGIAYRRAFGVERAR